MTEEPMVEPEAEPQPEFVTTLYADWLRIHESIRNMLATIDRLTERVEKAGWLAEQDSCTIGRLTRERDEALRVAARGVSFKGDAQDTLRWMNRALTAEQALREAQGALERLRATATEHHETEIWMDNENDGFHKCNLCAALAPNTEEGPQ